MKYKKSLVFVLIAVMTMALTACGKDVEVIGDNPEGESEIAMVEEEPEVTKEVQATPEVVKEEEAEDLVKPTEAVTDTDEKEDKEVNRDDIEVLTETVTLYAQKKVNVRKGPDTSFDIVSHLNMNDAVEVVGRCKSVPWIEIKFNEGTAFVHKDFLGENQIDLEALAAEQEAQAKAAEEAAAKQAEQQQQQQQQQQQPVTQPDPSQVASVLFIGDSRTCQMQAYTGGAGCTWICEYGQKFEWFESTAVPKADKMIGQGTKVVICMGVNDPGRCNDYARVVNNKAGEWNARGAKVYYVSVNPVAAPYEDKTPSIDNFNATMPSLLSGVKWIDTASVVKQGGFVLEDGIHYDANGNVTIFGLIYGCLK